jgi:beta-galactosidase
MHFWCRAHSGDWSWRPVSVTAPLACRDVLSGKPVAPGDDIRLSAWDVRVHTEERTWLTL